jgi:magnesium transporter
MTTPTAPSSSLMPTVILESISYNKENFEKHSCTTAEELFINLKEGHTNWINLDGLNNQDVVEKIQAHFSLSPLLIDDVLSDQRPKAEEFEHHFFFTLKMLYRIEENYIDYEQISFVLGQNYLISFQEKEGDLFDGFRERIRLDQGRVRKKEADYLMYRLTDIIVDSYYNVLDRVGEIIDDTEEKAYEEPSTYTFQKIQKIKKELIFLRKALYPLRDAVSKISKGEFNYIKEENLPYYSDLYDHIVHLIDSVDTYRDLTSNLLDVHWNAMNSKMNEVMKVLTVISTIFMPLTFVVGVYGMNFDYMPELHWKWGYFAVWGVIALLVSGMIAFFRYKKWF